MTAHSLPSIVKRAIQALHAFVRAHHPVSGKLIVISAIISTLGFGFILFGVYQASVSHVYAQEQSGEVAALSQQVVRTPLSQDSSDESLSSILVDVSGSVVHPGVYSLTSDARVSDALGVAGGVNQDADARFVSKFINGSEKITDQQKIYIPSSEESKSLLSCEALIGGDKQSLEESEIEINANSSKGVSINTASEGQLESLPGIGAKRAEDIANNRPYSSIEELLEKKVVPQNVFNEIKEAISL